MWIDVNDSYGQADHWWLRSPNLINGFVVAFLVYPVGGVSSGSGVDNSCGRILHTLRGMIILILYGILALLVIYILMVVIQVVPTEIKRLLVHHPLCTRSLIYMKREEIRNTVYFKRQK